MPFSHIAVAALSLAAHTIAQTTSTSTPSSTTAQGAAGSASTTGSAREGHAGGDGSSSKAPDPSTSYSRWVVISLFGLAAIVFVYRIVVLSLRHFRHLVSLTHDKQNFFRETYPAHGWFKRNILYAPLFGKRHTNEMNVMKSWGIGILPTRFQLLLLLLIIAGNVLYCLYNIPFSAGPSAYLYALRNRTGVAAVLNCIPLVLFASRNNPLIWILDVSFDSFNLLHRWFGRMVAIEAAAHAICWAASKAGGFAQLSKSLSEPSLLINSGTIAVVAMAVMPIQASSLLRHAFYETFLHLHQGLAITAFAGVWVHLNTLKEHKFIEAVIAVWVLERGFRFITLVYRNVGSSRTTATVELMPGDAMRVTLHMARPWRLRSGQHMFLTIPSIGLWTSHPFSVAWSSEESIATTYELKNTKQVNVLDVEKGLARNVGADDTVAIDGSHSVSALIRARGGFTSSLLRKAKNAPQGKLTLSAFVEGPYGQAHSMASYGTVLLFAGGVGITHMLPYVRSLVAGASGHTVATRRVTLVWIIQSPEHLEWIRPWMTTILAMEGRRDTLRIEIFITRPRSAREVRSPSSTVRMYVGRPVVGEIISREAQNAIGAMGVSVCGPGGLGDDVRKGVRNWCGEAEVDLLEESFSW